MVAFHGMQSRGEDKEEVQADRQWSRTTGNHPITRPQPGFTRSSAGNHIHRGTTEITETTVHVPELALHHLLLVIPLALALTLDPLLATEKNTGYRLTALYLVTSALALRGPVIEVEMRTGTGTGTVIAKTENEKGIDATETTTTTGTTTQTIMTVVIIGALTTDVLVAKVTMTMSVRSDTRIATEDVA